MKEVIKKLLRSHIYDKDEGRSAIEFVSELLDVYADEMERDEPYAVNTIRECRAMASRLYGIELDEI